MKKITSIILARGGSKRIPKKNLEKINGISLVELAILQSKESKYINEIIVSTDDKIIKNVSEKAGAIVFDRPEHLRDDVTVNEADNILLDITNTKKKLGENIDIIVLLYPTSPLRKVKYIDEAIEKILNENYDSVLSLVKDHCYIWHKDKKNNLKPINYDYKNRVPSAVHDFVQYRENKSVYACKSELLIKNKVRIGGKIGYVIMKPLESIDVDNYDELELCRLLNKQNK